MLGISLLVQGFTGDSRCFNDFSFKFDDAIWFMQIVGKEQKRWPHLINLLIPTISWSNNIV